MTQTASEETLSSIGNTPLVKLDSLSGSAGDFYAKLSISVKDRAAYWMIRINCLMKYQLRATFDGIIIFFHF